MTLKNEIDELLTGINDVTKCNRYILNLVLLMSCAVNSLKISFFFFKNCHKSNFHYHIWIGYGDCIQMSTNKACISLVVLDKSVLDMPFDILK